METVEDKEFKEKVLASGNIGQTLITLAKSSNFEHPSKRPIRNGFMAAVTKIANLLLKNKSPAVTSYLASLGEEWTKFVYGELKRSNDNNNRSLGGHNNRPSMDDEDNDKDYEMNMEKIMQKFSNFNTSLNNNSNDDDEEEEDINNDSNENNQKTHEKDDFAKDYQEHVKNDANQTSPGK